MCALAASSGGVRTHPAPRIDNPSVPAHTAVGSTDATFRLGTAGRPFAWSTAVGDLNADGRPDVAIADRVGRRASGFAYAIQLSLAGGRSQSVAFESDQDALSVALRDVDHDRDLDVVVTGAVSMTVVAVWLNDGFGQFRRATPQIEDSAWQAATAALTDTVNLDPAAVAALPRSSSGSLVCERTSGGVPLRSSTLVTCGAFRTARRSLAALRCRAPPHTLASAATTT